MKCGEDIFSSIIYKSPIFSKLFTFSSLISIYLLFSTKSIFVFNVFLIVHVDVTKTKDQLYCNCNNKLKVEMIFEISAIFITSVCLAIFYIAKKNRLEKIDFHGKHVVITGGNY